jgi:hypothetical protein
MAAMDTYDWPLDMAETSGTFGVELTSVATFARRTLAGVAPSRFA